MGAPAAETQTRRPTEEAILRRRDGVRARDEAHRKRRGPRLGGDTRRHRRRGFGRSDVGVGFGFETGVGETKRPRADVGAAEVPVRRRRRSRVRRRARSSDGHRGDPTRREGCGGEGAGVTREGVHPGGDARGGGGER